MGISINTGKLAQISVENSAACAVITLQGAQVVHYQREGEAPLLWLSETAIFEEGKAIRGGIPICWPWFGPHPQDKNLPNHGFARTSLWEHVSTVEENANTTVVRLRLQSNAQSRGVWPHDFTLELTVRVGERLELALSTSNTGESSFEITQALHSYLKVDAIETVKVKGLDQCRYFDKVNNTDGNVQVGLLGFEEETDRIYAGVSGAVEVLDGTRSLFVTMQGGQSVVVWNPAEALANTMKDLSSHRQMLCVESANVRDDKVHLKAGDSHTLGTTLASR